MHLPHTFIAPFVLVSMLWQGIALSAPAAGNRGMVTTAHPDATLAGIEMLRAGGNAADAAAAAAFALAVAEPYSSGIGGGGFALMRFEESLVYLDFREVAPRKATKTMFVRKGVADALISRDTALGAAVPGAVAGYLEIQARFGKLTREQVLAPAIRLAEHGVKVDQRMINYITMRLDVMQKDPEISRIFLHRDEAGQWSAPKLGQTVVQQDLANTLREIAKDGSKAFYQGGIAKKLVRDTEARGGILGFDDLKRYKVRERKPLLGSYRGHAVVTAPSPSSGGQILLTILNIMETRPAVAAAWRDPETVHLYIEASKRAYADRSLLGDPDYVAKLDTLIPELLSKSRAQELATLIVNRAAPASHVPAAQGTKNKAKERNDTTHLNVVDADGNAIAMTTTINYAWGAGYVATGTGIVMNDEMDDFSVAPGVPNAYGIVGSEANAIAAGKVPLSSMTPTFVFEGDSIKSPLRLVVGSPGGARIPSTVAQTIMYYFDYGADVEKAVSLGRIHHQHLPDVTRIEPYALETTTINQLKMWGHTFEQQDPWCNTTAIAIDPKTHVRTGAADPRGQGIALAE